jgi:hypothetical protein
MAKKMVDIQLVSIESDVANAPIQLETVLVALNDFKKEGNNKSYQIRIWNNDNNSNFVSGLVITEQIKDLPPKRNKDTGVFSSLGLQDNERLAYGNAFLYDKDLNVIFYEVNGNGCYLDQFSSMIKEEWNTRQQGQQNQIIDITFASIPKNGGYQQYLSMYYLKEFVLEVACPQAIIQEYQNRNKTLLGAISPDLNRAVNNNADVMQIRYATLGKKANEQGLDASRIRKLVKAGQFILTGNQRANVRELKVVGFEISPEGRSHRTTADLITDLLKGSIELPTVSQHVDLQEDSRRTQIESLHSNMLQIIQTILQP